MNARFYDSATGRFISQDSYSGNPYDPWTQHLYTYCGNNPTNMVDPTGHVPLTNAQKAKAYNIQAENIIAKANQFKQQAEVKALMANSYRAKALTENTKEYEKLAECYSSMSESYWRLFQKYAGLQSKFNRCMLVACEVLVFLWDTGLNHGKFLSGFWGTVLLRFCICFFFLIVSCFVRRGSFQKNEKDAKKVLTF